MSEPLEGMGVLAADGHLHPTRITVTSREIQAQCRTCGAHLESASFAEMDAVMVKHVTEAHGAKPACPHANTSSVELGPGLAGGYSLLVCKDCGEDVE